MSDEKRIGLYWLSHGKINSSDSLMDFLTERNSNNIKYRTNFYVLIEHLHRALKLSKGEIFQQLMAKFPIDSLPRATPSNNTLDTRASATVHPIRKYDNVTTENLLAIEITVNDKSRFTLRLIYDEKAIDSINDAKICHHEIKLTAKGKQKKVSSEYNMAMRQLESFYLNNICLIRELRNISFTVQEDITIQLLARLLSPFWLTHLSSTNLEEQANLIKKVFKGLKEQNKSLGFKKQKSRKRIPKRDASRLIEIHRDNCIKYAILLINHNEGIYIFLIDKINERDYAGKPGGSDIHQSEKIDPTCEILALFDNVNIHCEHYYENDSANKNQLLTEKNKYHLLDCVSLSLSSPVSNNVQYSIAISLRTKPKKEGSKYWKLGNKIGTTRNISEKTYELSNTNDRRYHSAFYIKLENPPLDVNDKIIIDLNDINIDINDSEKLAEVLISWAYELDTYSECVKYTCIEGYLKTYF